MERVDRRRASEASSLDSTDFYSADTHHDQRVEEVSSTVQTNQPTVTNEPTDSAVLASAPVPASAPTYEEKDDDNCSEDMDLSDSRDATPESQDASATTDAGATLAANSTATLAATATPAAVDHVGTKRKLSDTENADAAALGLSPEGIKKIKVKKPDNGVPDAARCPEVWQRVFLHLSPAMLCRCLRVCKDFRFYLTGIKNGNKQTTKGPVDSDFIWVQSRKTHYTFLPLAKPLSRFQEDAVPELAMLRLICSQTCQFCGKSAAPVPTNSHLNAGPARYSVRIIWPFGVCSCGPCLEERSVKDTEILSLKLDPRLRLGIPHGFLNQELHFAPELLRQRVGIPGAMRFSKIYYRPDWDELCRDLENAKAFGDGAAEEWLKGLEGTGKQAMAESARWESFELQYPPGTDLVQLLREYDVSSFPGYLEQKQSNPAGEAVFQPSMAANGTHPLPQPVHVFQNHYASQYSAVAPQLPSPTHARPARNLHEVEMARQARRAEIERRCREELMPPLEPEVLVHMESFKNALMIVRPLADIEWENLKPKLEQQREAAEFAEHEKRSQLAALQASVPYINSETTSPYQVRDTNEVEHELAQKPLRRLLAEYADDFINGHWRGGQLLTKKDSAPMFAIQVLMEVHRRFKTAEQHGSLPSLINQASERSTPPPRIYLSLENMKWVFDNKIKHLTDPYCRELFVCAGDGCADEAKPKWFPFEGLIQHYGAKHTSDFSKGNVVVHWQSGEWPDTPPFDVNPTRFLSTERKTSGNKNQHRARNAASKFQQAGPTTPSDLHTNTYQGEGVYSAGFNGYQVNQVAYHSAPPSSDDQINKLASDALEIWNALNGVQDLENSVRLQTVIRHVVMRFTESFRQQPKLDDLTKALASKPETRALKSAHGLVCRICAAQNSDGSYWTRSRHAAKHANPHSLIRHFQLSHLSHNAFLDWTREMLDVPEDPIVRELLRTPGMDDTKLELIALAFPTAFPAPLPKIGTVTEDSVPVTAEDEATIRLRNQLESRLGKKQNKQAKKKGPKSAKANRDDSQDPLPEPKEDEYDPRRPMFVESRKREVDAVEFDFDAGKSQLAQLQLLPGGLNLAPETLEALRSVAATQSQQGMGSRYAEQSRSPSVGRDAQPIKIPGSGPVMTPTGQPDIAAILASLTDQTAAPYPAATPASNRSGSAPHQSYVELRAKSLGQHPEVYRSQASRPTSGYSSAYHSSANGATTQSIQDLQAALSQNSRNFEQNQQPVYAEASHYGRPAGQPAPRYYSVYEEDQPSTAHMPIYREPPVQYVQVPRRDHEYPYERPARQPIYVDQYGLELIPVEAPPASASFPPDQYGQQQYLRHPEQQVYSTLSPGARLPPVYDERRAVYPPPRYTYENGR